MADTRILLVDDEKEVTALLAKRLVRRGYQCDTAADGLQAVEAMREEARAKGLKPKYSGCCRERGLSSGPGRVVRAAAQQAATRPDSARGLRLGEGRFKGRFAKKPGGPGCSLGRF